MAVLDFRASYPPIIGFGRQRQRRLGREGRRVAGVARAARRRHFFLVVSGCPALVSAAQDRRRCICATCEVVSRNGDRRARPQWHGERLGAAFAEAPGFACRFSLATPRATPLRSLLFIELGARRPKRLAGLRRRLHRRARTQKRTQRCYCRLTTPPVTPHRCNAKAPRRSH